MLCQVRSAWTKSGRRTRKTKIADVVEDVPTVVKAQKNPEKNLRDVRRAQSDSTGEESLQPVQEEPKVKLVGEEGGEKLKAQAKATGDDEKKLTKATTNASKIKRKYPKRIKTMKFITREGPTVEEFLRRIDGQEQASAITTTELVDEKHVRIHELDTSGDHHPARQEFKGFPAPNTFERLLPNARPLPLPPFLRPEPRLKDRYSSKLEFAGIARLDVRHTVVKSFRNAPFSTAFAQNPYAHALATPVRQCVFSGARLPTSCLLDFHLVPSNSHDANGKVALMPLSLAVAMIPKNKAKYKRTDDEYDAISALQRETKHHIGTASYVTNQRAAVAFASSSQDPKRQRVRQFIVGRRANAILGEESPHGVVWRDDMPDVVLDGLRKVVIKKLRFFFTTRLVRDTPGLVAEVPAGERRRLDGVEDVVAVLRLKDEPALDNEEVFGASEARKNGETGEDNPSGSLLKSEMEPSNPPAPHRTPGTNTRIHHTGEWAKTTAVYLENVFPLSHPRQPSSLYFATLRYRNQRVALYNLFELLGEQGVLELVKGTVFAGGEYRGKDGKVSVKEVAEWVTVKANRATVSALQWCAKLAGYVAGGKRKSAEGGEGSVKSNEGRG